MKQKSIVPYYTEPCNTKESPKKKKHAKKRAETATISLSASLDLNLLFDKYAEEVQRRIHAETRLQLLESQNASCLQPFPSDTVDVSFEEVNYHTDRV